MSPKAGVKELGFEAMTENASLNVVAPKGTTGFAENLENAISTSADTAVSEMPGGTMGVQGPYG